MTAKEIVALEQAVVAAIALHQSGDIPAAQSAYETLLRDHPYDPNVLMNLSTLHLKNDNPREAERLLKRLIDYHPTLPQPYFGYGNVLMALGQYDKAIVSFQCILALVPDNANAHWNIAVCYLLQGDYARGLPHFEWRFKSDLLKAHARHLDVPLWLGDASLEGKTILLYPEQGFGDFIQLARYFSRVKEQARQVILEVPPALMRLMQVSFLEYTCIAENAALPPVDFQCPVMSLPLALGVTLDTLPQAVPYLTVPPLLSALWHERLGASTQPRVGLAWSGAPLHRNDKNRSIPLGFFEPLLALPYEFHALQKEVRAGDLPLPTTLHVHGPQLHDFADTAALIQQLDLVISVDTSVAHLAAALGKPVWLLLPDPPDYRWMLKRADSPLYPTMRIFRIRDRQSGWPKVIAAVIEALKSFTRE